MVKALSALFGPVLRWLGRSPDSLNKQLAEADAELARLENARRHEGRAYAADQLGREIAGHVAAETAQRAKVETWAEARPDGPALGEDERVQFVDIERLKKGESSVPADWATSSASPKGP